MRSKQTKTSRIIERIIELSLMACGLLSILTTVGIICVLLFETIAFFKEVSVFEFLTDREWTPQFTNKRFGVLSLLSGTVLISLIAVFTAVPLGLLTAIFLSEYAPDRLRRLLKPILEILAGVPTIVYGYFALLFVTPLLQRLIPSLEAFNALSPGIVMGIMILPLVSSLSEDAMFAVPRSLRDAAYALGSSRLQVSWRVVVPAAFSGITASFVIAVSRAIGETMLVTIAAGKKPTFTFNPLVAIETMTAYIVQVSLGDTPSGTLVYRTIFAVGMVLFVSTFMLNILGDRLRRRFRERYE
ncbi:MAG: phosphate ABC transporter permease subunit PstC [Candidatus Poribacteria bacterium]|nr:phosphate ABC transporter permease subunit PstC [Candidatus Poribacteria bacterium]